MKENGFVLSRETPDFCARESDYSFSQIITMHTTETETLVLLRQKKEVQGTSIIVEITNDWANFSWLPLIQNAMKDNNRVIIYSQNKILSGIMGLFNCIRMEPGGNKVRCFFILDDKAPKFNLSVEFYNHQLEKDISMNIYKDGDWGTYRHLLVDSVHSTEMEHCYMNVAVRGDLSSLRWIESPLSTKSTVEPGKTIVQVSCHLVMIV